MAGSLLAFLLLSPFVKIKKNIVENPTVVIAIDNSSSILQDKNFNAKAFRANIESLTKALSDKCQVEIFSFGSALQKDSLYHFSDKETDISSAIEEVDNTYFNQNLTALVIASDGLFNKGIHPFYSKTSSSFPIYTIALGDSNIKKDISIIDVHHNKFAYLNDKTTVELDIEANNYAGAKSELSLYHILPNGNAKIIGQPIQINSNRFNQTATLYIDCKTVGLGHYRAVIGTLPGESVTQNNTRDFFIEVLDGRKKILIVGSSPHPDMTALKQSLEQSKNYQVDIDFTNARLANLNEYQLVVMHQMPSNTNAAGDWNKAILEKKIPCLYIITSHSQLALFNSIQSNLEITKQADAQQDLFPSIPNSFDLFTLTEESKALMKRVPPLDFTYSSIRPKSALNILLKQKIGAIETEFPLIAFGESNGVKNGYIIGEGIWRWRLYEFQQNQSHTYFDEYFTKIFNYLAVKKDNRPFRVNLAKNIYRENEAVKLEAQLYNPSFELVNTPDASIEIKNREGKTYKFNFAKKDKIYSLDIGYLPAGDYDYKAVCNYNGTNYIADGAFIISPLQLELSKITADHQLLNSLAAKRNGSMYYPSQIDLMAKEMLEKLPFKKLLYESSETNPINNLWWILAIIILLLAAEWFIRKYLGDY
ncbi:MAG: VWA domain-containing protein [Chitinophagales bacterium]|nr:VWA domain-containing protein [Chitinophagales bacterium]